MMANKYAMVKHRPFFIRTWGIVANRVLLCSLPYIVLFSFDFWLSCIKKG